PVGHPAHPSAVKRSIVSRGGATYIDMKVHCEASKSACDTLVADFQKLNDRMVDSIRGSHSAAPATSEGSGSKQAAASDTSEKINITSDSAPGWLPSAEQRARVPEVTREFLSALDGGQYEKAYGLMAESQRALEPFPSFSERLRKF